MKEAARFLDETSVDRVKCVSGAVGCKFRSACITFNEETKTSHPGMHHKRPAIPFDAGEEARGQT